MQVILYQGYSENKCPLTRKETKETEIHLQPRNNPPLNALYPYGANNCALSGGLIWRINDFFHFDSIQDRTISP